MDKAVDVLRREDVMDLLAKVLFRDEEVTSVEPRLFTVRPVVYGLSAPSPE